MKHLLFTDKEQEKYPIVFLVSQLLESSIKAEYLDPYGIPYVDTVAIKLHYNTTKKKTPVSEIKKYITEELISILENIKAQYIVVADAEYFKVLTKQTKADVNLGYVCDCVFGPWKVVYVPNYKTIFHNPDETRRKINQGLTALLDSIKGTYSEPGKNIIHTAYYPKTVKEIEQYLQMLLDMNVPLTVDLEAFGLKHNTCGIGTIAFSWDEHSGIAFPVDYEPIAEATKAPFGRQVYNKPVRALLRQFFEQYSNKLICHNIAFDVYVLIYQLYMTDILDTAGLFKGMDVLLKNWDCSKLISYLATNSCARMSNSLKDQAQEFAGNYAETDIKNIATIPLDHLLQYNLIDTLSTWHTLNKHYPTLIEDEQQEIYENIFKPATVDIIQMQLTGMPVSMSRILEIKNILQQDELNALAIISAHPIIKKYTYKLNENWVVWKNSKLKVKQVSLADANEVFNPNSDDQLRTLLFQELKLPVVNLTASKLPSTDNDSLTALVNHTDKQDIKDLLEAFLDYSAVNKILTTYIPAFEKAALGKDNHHYLFGSFNLGGTISGRLSSNSPNLQNIPSSNAKRDINKKISKLIKSCFKAPPGYLFIGLDFASLEDKISALTTKDPNKIKVYTDGYDGHSLRAFTYFKEQMPDILDTVASINSVAKKYPTLRQDSKTITFALTYQGTFRTLMSKEGFSETKAKSIESRYHELYKTSDAWIDNKLREASTTGYVTVAFGLRVRTPILKQTIRSTSKTPYEAIQEGRSAGNALGQSWGLLNSRAATDFLTRVRNSEYKYEIKPSSQIHDAQYYIVKDDIDVVLYVNKHLVKASEWQEHPDITHDSVKLGGEVAIYYPTWADEIKLSNNITAIELRTLVNNYKQTI